MRHDEIKVIEKCDIIYNLPTGEVPQPKSFLSFLLFIFFKFNIIWIKFYFV